MGKRESPRWKRRLELELSYQNEFLGLDGPSWTKFMTSRRVTSRNHDTVLSLDWPHYCVGATEACGGERGWCYTFQGYQVTEQHNKHVEMVDVLARKEPRLFSDLVVQEVSDAVRAGLLPYPNLRYSGSGEVVAGHIDSLANVSKRGVKLWGFTRTIAMASALREIGASVIVSCDRTSPERLIEAANTGEFPLAYTSSGVDDRPPDGTIVTFPIHRGGRVREVVDVSSLCPKVVADFLNDSRPKGSCQTHCQRCHLRK